MQITSKSRLNLIDRHRKCHSWQSQNVILL